MSHGMVVVENDFPEPQIIPKIELPDFDLPECPADLNVLPEDGFASLRKLISDSFLFLHDKVQANHTKQMKLIKQMEKKREKDHGAVMLLLKEINTKRGVKRSAADEIATKNKAKRAKDDLENAEAELFPDPYAPFPPESESENSDEDDFIYSDADKTKKDKKLPGYSRQHILRLKKQIEERRNATKSSDPATTAIEALPDIKCLDELNEIAPRTVLADITRHVREIKAEVHELSVVEEVRHKFLKKQVQGVRKQVEVVQKAVVPKQKIKWPIPAGDFESTKEKMLNDPLFRDELYQMFKRSLTLRSLFSKETLAKYSAKGRGELLELGACPLMTAVIDAWTQRGPKDREAVMQEMDKELGKVRHAFHEQRGRHKGAKGRNATTV